MIQKVAGFSLEMINEKPYLLPYGQNLADRRKGMALDRIGLYIWNTLDEVQTENELFFRYAAHRGLGVSEFQEGKQDLENFLLDLERRGFIIIDERRQLPELSVDYYKGINIGGLRIKLYGPSDLYSEKLNRFTDMSVVEPSPADLVAVITESIAPSDYSSKLLVRSSERIIAANSRFFTFVYPNFDLIREVRISTDGVTARIYIKNTQDEKKREQLREQIFLILRSAYFYLVSKHHITALHSTAIQYQNRVWVLCGASRQLRKDYAALWNACYGTKILNEDFSLISTTHNEALFHSIPWGAQPLRYHTDTKKLGGIILLKNEEENHLISMQHSSRILQIASHMITPNWTANQLHHQYTLADEVADALPIWRLGGKANEASVELLKTEIDRMLFGA